MRTHLYLMTSARNNDETFLGVLIRLINPFNNQNRCKIYFDKPGSAQVGAIFKAQKYSNHILLKVAQCQKTLKEAI